MRRLSTIAGLALFCAAFSLAYPQPQPAWQDLQQRPFSPFHHTTQHVDPDLGADSKGHIGTYARFDNEQVLRVKISSFDQLKQLEAAVEDYNLDLWSDLRIGVVDVRVPPSKMDGFKAATHNIPHTVMIPNLQDLIPQQAPASLLRNSKTPLNIWDFADNSFWYDYRDFATLNNFTETMVKRHPKLVKRVSIGKTFEGREIFGLSIHGFKTKKGKGMEDSFDDATTFDDDDEYDDNDEYTLDEERTVLGQWKGKLESWWSWLFGTSKQIGRKPSKPKKHPKAIVIHAGLHAREWIGPAVVTYIAKELIQGYHRNRKITRMVDQFEFVIVPVLNADGYVYSWEQDRMWRKNRQPTSIPMCPGIDPNRSWGYKWGSGGNALNPCNEAYQGPKAFAALEAKMMSKYILKRKNVVGYLDFHAYSQLWMWPFGGDCDEIPRDAEDITECAMGAAKALYGVHGKKFSVGQMCDVVYQAAGGSIDWTYAVGKVKYSYGVELRDTGLHGFLLPASEILPSSEETLAGVMYYANFIRKREKQWR
ncbi:MAG: hypothetical protein J3Q66DRAFT_303854 [Benniella sp.]|nr:MAG: hypothetical protein J3Q66DRAFT_303854 [Benniella sp.]